MRTCLTCPTQLPDAYNRRICQTCKRKKYYTDTCECGGPKQKYSAKCKSCVDTGKSKNGNWKGGKTRHKSGYMQVRVVDPDTGKAMYMFEHRLVMQDLIGRPLQRNENVHHKNGVKDDNRIENLELWTTNQPSGQRVVDLIRYAKELLDLYGDDETRYET